MATKKRNLEMSPLQQLNRALRDETASALVIRALCNKLIDNMLRLDEEKPVTALSADFVMALHTMTARLQCLERENETLKRKLRRDNRKTSNKPQPELLKKEPEQLQPTQAN